MRAANLAVDDLVIDELVIDELAIDGDLPGAGSIAGTRVSTAMVLFTILVGLNLGDMIITHVGLQRGVLQEANPLMRDVVANLWTAAAVKVVALGAVAWFMYLIRARMKVVHATLLIAICWYIVVVAWNTAIVLDVGLLR